MQLWRMGDKRRFEYVSMANAQRWFKGIASDSNTTMRVEIPEGKEVMAMIMQNWVIRGRLRG